MRVAAVLTIAVLVGCGEEVRLVEVPADTTVDVSPLLPELPVVDAPGTPDGAPEADTAPADVPADDPGPPPVEGPHVLAFAQATGAAGAPCVETCALEAEGGTQLSLAVRYADAAEAPVEQTLVTYELEAPPEVARLSSFSTYTDAAGVASVELILEDVAEGEMRVYAEVPGDEEAGRLEFVVDVQVADVPPLVVSWTYLGSAPLEWFEVRAYGPGDAPGCATVHPDAVGGPSATLSKGPLAPGEPAVFESLPAPAGEETTWTLQVVGPFASMSTAHGCTSGIEVTPGKTRQVQLNVVDLPLLYQGGYDLTTTIDLVTGLDGTAGSAVGDVLEFFSHPGKIAVLAACEAPSGTLDTLCGWLVDDGQITFTGAILVDAADQAFVSLMAENLGAPVVFGGQALEETLRSVVLRAGLALDAEPTELKPGTKKRFFPDGTPHATWTTAEASWEPTTGCGGAGGGCEETAIHIELALEEVYGATPWATFDAATDGLGALHVLPHEVTGLHYGPLVNALVEHHLLPALFGNGTNGLPPVDSYDDLVATMFGDELCLYYDDCCWYFQQKLQDDIPAFLVPLAPAACEAAIPAAASWLRERLVELEGPLHLATPADAPCPASTDVGQRTVSRLGAAKAPCTWDATFQVGSPPFTPDTTWHADRTD